MAGNWNWRRHLVALGVVAAVVALPLLALAAPFPGGGYGGMMGGGYGAMGGLGGAGSGWQGAMWASHQRELAAATAVLGISEADLTRALLGGQKPADLAAAAGVDVADVTAAVTAARTAYLDEQVAAGVLTAEQAAWIQQMRTAMGDWTLYGGAMMNGGGCHGGWGAAGRV